MTLDRFISATEPESLAILCFISISKFTDKQPAKLGNGKIKKGKKIKINYLTQNNCKVYF